MIHKRRSQSSRPWNKLFTYGFLGGGCRPARRKPIPCCLSLEVLESRLVPSGSTLTGGGAVISAVNANSSVAFVVTADRALYRHDDLLGWTKLGGSGTIQAISATTEASGKVVVFAISMDNALFRHDFISGWQMLGAPGTIQSISAGTDQNGLADVFVISTGNDFLEFSSSSGWQQIRGLSNILSMSAVNNDRVVAVTADHSIFEHDDTFGWVPVASPGFAESVSAVTVGDGHVVIFAMTMDHALFSHDDVNGWTKVGGSGTIQSISADTDPSNPAAVFVISTAGDLLQFDTATGWRSIVAPGTIAEFSAAASDQLFATLSDGSVFRRDDTFGWLRMTDPGFGHL